MSAVLERVMTERQLMNAITEAARSLGYLVFHANTAQGSEPGYPDLTIAGHGIVVFLECKTERGRLRAASVTKRGRVLPGQAEWLDALAGARLVLADVARPSDLDGVLNLLKIGYEQGSKP